MSERKKRVKNKEPGINTNEVKAERLKAKGDNKLESTPTAERLAPTEKKELQTENSQLQTEQMEVHHHPDLHHKPKPWKEYLLEYLMIFLAVMTGFFAESYREHRSERSKEYEYVVNIRKDLVKETKNLDIWIPSTFDRVKRFDILISYLQTTGPVKNGSNMYYLARISTRNAIFEPSDNTILEMKSSGNLRLIRHREVINNLMEIERLLEQYRNLMDIEGKEDILSYPLLGELFDSAVFEKMIIVSRNRVVSEQEYASLSVNNIIEPPTGNPQLLSHDKAKLNLLVYYLHQRKASFLGETRMLRGIKNMVDQVIKQIDQQYNLDDE